MSDNSSITNTDLDTSLSSLLGINGPLRVRPHNDTTIQKAHAILRRVESSADPSEDSSVVLFRVFAHKNISLKPGKEVLLTIAVDGQFKNQVVMLEGSLKGTDEDSDHDGTTQVEEEPQVIEEEEKIVQPEPVVPPKMRRQWIRKPKEVSPAAGE
ncbi:hypothetical protein C8R46DRAFT_459884 [Mycena filopes]|nr:hypothetical protein C8R46DRAFT_459884 [Mycena filopes]